MVKASYERTGDPILTDPISEGGLRLKNIHYIQDDPGEGVRWVLDANEVKFSKDRQHISFNNFQMKLEPENSPSWELEGSRGNYNKNSNEINLKGDLRGYTENGYRIPLGNGLFQTAEEITYKQYMADPSAGQVMVFGVVKESVLLANFMIRLKVVKNKITERDQIMTETALEIHPQIGYIVGGGLKESLRVRLTVPSEDVQEGAFVVIESGEWQFYGLVTDIQLGSTDPRFADEQSEARFPPNLARLLHGQTLYTNLEVLPALMLEQGPDPEKETIEGLLIIARGVDEQI